MGIAATGFCHPGGILQLFLSTRSTNFAAAAAARSLEQIRAGFDMVIIDKIFINNLDCVGALDSSWLSFSIGNKIWRVRQQQLARPKKFRRFASALDGGQIVSKAS
jgi:hypothetical protein